jgi:antitoxin YefM
VQYIAHKPVMDIVTFSDARNNLKSVLDKVVDDSMPTVIFRQKGRSVVVVPKDEYDSWTETNYLLSNPVNAQRLRDAVAEMDAGKGIEIDPKTMKPI